MKRMTTIWKGVLVAGALLSAMPGFAKPLAAADQQLLSSYALDMTTLHKYEKAIASVDAACSKDRKLREEDIAAHPDESIEQAIKRVEKTSFYATYIKPAGLSAKDAVLLPVVLIGAGAVVEMNADPSKLPGLSKAQIDFYRAHQAEIKALKLTSRCGEDEEE